MACNLVTNKARSLKSLIDEDILDENLNIKDEPAFYDASIRVKIQMEDVLGSKIPSTVFPFETNPNFATPNNELFYRADAAEGIIYPENVQFKDNYQYPPEQQEEKESLNTKLTRLLKGIGVTVENLTSNHRQAGIEGVADTFNKVAYASLNNANVNTLPEEAAHMFVEFIEDNDKSLFNRMMADIPKFGIYKTVKDQYMPIYGNITDVKKEAIGKAIAEYIVGNQVDPNVDTLKAWFQQVLNKVKEALAKIGILSESDYNNYFELTANQILRGDFTGVFKGRGTYFNADPASSLGLVDIRDMQLELRNVEDADGKVTSAYFFNGRRVKQRVSEKIRDKRKPIKADTTAQEIGKKYGTKGHNDLLNLWKIKLGKVPADSIEVQTNPVIFARLSTFVDALYDQFPNAKWRTEVKIVNTDGTLAGTIDLMNEEEDGTVNIFDYKFRESSSEFLTDTDRKQLGEYKQMLRNSYGFKKFGQIRIIPIKTHYSGSLENKVLTDIEVGTNTYQTVPERSYLNPLPARFEISKNETINRTLQYLNEELIKTENRPTKGDAELETKKRRIEALQQTIARLQITEDITSLETLAENDKERMEYIMKKKNPTPNELYDLYQLKEHYRDIISKGYTTSASGETNITLTELSVFAQNSSNEIDAKLEVFFNENELDIHRVNKPMSWWSRLTQLSDYDNPAFQAFNRLITKGFNQNEIKIRKEFADIKSIVEQIRQEAGGATGVEIYNPILQKGKDGKPTNRLIPKTKKEWYDLHKANWPGNKKALLPYFDMDRWKTYYDPLEQDFLQRHAGLSDDALKNALLKFQRGQEAGKGIGNKNSEFFNIPDQYLNDDYLKYVKNAPDSGLAKLYNKYIEINRFARTNADVDVPLTLLPYVQKGTIEMLANDGFNIKNLTTNALDKLKSQEWETFDIDSNGQRVYKIPLRYKGKEFDVQEDQSHDLGEMLMLWTESVNQNAYLRETHSTAQLYQLALKKSKEVILRNGQPVLENGELRLADTSDGTMQKYQEYLNAYYYGVKNEDSDFDVLGYSGHKIVKTAMSYLSGNAIGLNVFSGFANLTGGYAQMVSLAAKGNQFTYKQLGKAATTLHDPKARALFSLMDVTNSEFKRDRIAGLSANKLEGLVSWDKLFVLQHGGDWMIKNTLLSAMAQNYTIKEGKIVKKEGDEESLMYKMNFGKDGKIEIQGFDLNDEANYFELLKFRDKVNRVAAEVAGNINERDRVLANNTLWGQLLLQFRSWLLPMANSRFGQLKYNSNLEEHQVGKYRSTFAALANKKILQVAKEIITEQSSPTFHAILEKKYETARLVNPDLTIEEFKKLYIENVRSTFTELALVGLIAALKFGMDDDDSSDDGIIKKVIYRGIARTASELSFWYNPDSALSIVKTPVPLLNLATNTLDFVGASGGRAFDIVFGEEEDTKYSEKFVKLIPGVSAYHKLLKEIDED